MTVLGINVSNRVCFQSKALAVRAVGAFAILTTDLLYIT